MTRAWKAVAALCERSTGLHAIVATCGAVGLTGEEVVSLLCEMIDAGVLEQHRGKASRPLYRRTKLALYDREGPLAALRQAQRKYLRAKGWSRIQGRRWRPGHDVRAERWVNRIICRECLTTEQALLVQEARDLAGVVPVDPSRS